MKNTGCTRKRSLKKAMSQHEPLTATFSRDAIEKRINESLEREGEINREFTEVTPSINDLIYDELRNIHGLLQERLGQDGVLDSIDDRICEANNLLFDIKAKQVNTNELRKVVTKDDAILEDDYGRPLLTQKDIDEYMNSVKDYYVFDDEGKCKENQMSSKSKKVKLKSRDRYLIYKTLGSKIANLKKELSNDETSDETSVSLQYQVNEAENLIEKLKNS